MLIIKENEKKLIPADRYDAICTAIVDLGEHINKFNPAIRQAKVWLEFTFLHEGKETSLGKDYTQSLDQKSNLRKDLVSWRGKEFTDEELRGFDLQNVLGVACEIIIQHKVSNGMTYANIANILKIKKGTPKPNITRDLRIITAEDFTNEMKLEGLPRFIKDKIINSLTYKALNYSAEDETNQLGE